MKATNKILLCTLAYLFLVGTGFVQVCIAQEIHVLALAGDGSASVLIDEEARLAYIIDGGRTKKGITGALIEGKPVLEYLSTRVNTLVIACSHPHLDHMGGLKAMVQSASINRFRVAFVDDKEINDAKSLANLYWHSPARAAPPEILHASSVYNDAFSKVLSSLKVTNASMAVHNFVYDPAKIGKDSHDRAMITQYSVGSKSKSRQMVDFDDASTKLVTAWAGRKGARADVLIYPHHGSRNNEISLLLNDPKRYHLTDVIISVNRQNRYFHPSPDVLLELVQKLGPEHIYVTDSEIGNNVSVRADGELVTGDSVPASQRLAKLVDARIEEARTELLGLVQEARATSTVRPSAGPDRERLVAYIGGGAVGGQERAGRATTLLSDLEDLEGVRGVITKTNRSQRDWLAPFLVAVNLRGNPPGGDESRGGPPPPEGSDAGGGEGPRPEIPRSSGSGEGALQTHGATRSGQEAWMRLRQGGDKQVVRTGRVKGELAFAVPRFGGVILGNDVTGPPVRDIEFVAIALGEDDHHHLESKDNGDIRGVYIRAILEDGKVGEYTDVTPIELDVAYNLVQPTREITRKYPVTEEDAGLVGMSKIDGDWWEFGIHPAVADTSLAQDAMRLDMFLVAADKLLRQPVPSAPGYIVNIPIRSWAFNTYQWYDAESEVEVRDGRLVIYAKSSPASCLMRVRLVQFQPLWYDSRNPERSFEREMMFRVMRENNKPDGSPPLRRREIEQALNGEVEDLARQPREDSESVTPYLAELCGSFDALTAVERLARIVGLLHWYRETSHKALPPLPTGMPARVPGSVPAKWRLADVFPAPTEPRPLASNDDIAHASNQLSNQQSSETSVLDSPSPHPRYTWIGVAILVVFIVMFQILVPRD